MGSNGTRETWRDEPDEVRIYEGMSAEQRWVVERTGVKPSEFRRQEATDRYEPVDQFGR
jgi:hypothetical protein